MRRPYMRERILRAVFEEIQDVVAYLGELWDDGFAGQDHQSYIDLYEWIESIMVKMERGLNER
jgi:hypothetical protein